MTGEKSNKKRTKGGGGEKRDKIRIGEKITGPASDKRETKIGDASFHMTSGDVMKMDGQPRRRA